MVINIAEAVIAVGEAFSAGFEQAFGGIEFLGETYEFPNGVSVSCEWRYDGEGVIVTGRFDSDIAVRCARCTEEFVYTIGFNFAEYYKKQPEEGTYAYQDDVIDLSQMLEDNVVINLPMRFLCKPDCKGLCIHCGKYLGECDCSPEAADVGGPFAGLAKLYDDEEV